MADCVTEGPCIVCGHQTPDKSRGGGSHGTRPYWHWRCVDGEECAVRRNARKRRPRPESEVRAEWRARRNGAPPGEPKP